MLLPPIVFAGLLDAVRCYPPLTPMRRAGQADTLRAHGEALAGERGFIDAAAEC